MKSLKELAEEYNAIVIAAGQGSMKTIKKFSDRKTAKRRLAALRTQFPDVEVTLDPSARAKGSSCEKEPETYGELIADNLVQEKTPPAKKPKKGLNPFGSVAAMKILYNLKVENKDVTRKDYIAAAEAAGIKKTTASAQWKFSWAYLENRFGDK